MPNAIDLNPRESSSISIIETTINGNDAWFVIYQILPCSPDIYCVFLNPADNSLYALQNTGAQFWGKWCNTLDEDNYFLLPITSYLIKDRENCLSTFYKWCRESELGEIPVVKEEFVNPFLPTSN